MDGFEKAREDAFRIDVGRRRETEAADERGGQIAENVAEEIRADDDIEPLGRTDEGHRQRVDVHLVDFQFRIVFGDFRENAIPEDHGVRQ